MHVRQLIDLLEQQDEDSEVKIELAIIDEDYGPEDGDLLDINDHRSIYRYDDKTVVIKADFEPDV